MTMNSSNGFNISFMYKYAVYSNNGRHYYVYLPNKTYFALNSNYFHYTNLT